MVARRHPKAHRFSMDSVSEASNGTVSRREGTHMNNRTKTTVIYLSILLLAGSQGALAADAETRLSVTTQGLASEQDTASTGPQDEYGALTTLGNRNKSSRSAEQQKVVSNNAAAPNTDFWFYDAYVDLYADIDRDGFFSGIELTFDADTIYAIADVYAVVYLSYELGPWNEYAVTEDFTILGASGTDEYFIETDLVAGYPTGDYDILIELFDAFDNSFVASIGPEDTSELAILPLEDMNRDALETTQIVVNSSGGGSFSWLLLLGLGVAVRARRNG